MFIIVLSLIGLLYLKWIIIITTLPLQILYGIYFQHQNCLIVKLLAIPYYILEKVEISKYAIYTISTFPSMHLRRLYYKAIGVSMGKRVTLYFKTEIRAPYKLKIGDYSIIGDNTILDARRNLTIGQNVNISANVSIYTLQHDYRNEDFSCENSKKKSVEIDNRVWIGCNVIILPGVHIGEGAVCCANCVVTKDVEPFSVVAGIPAKKIGERPRNLSYKFDKFHISLL